MIPNKTKNSVSLNKKLIVGFVVSLIFAFTLGYQVASEGYTLDFSNNSVRLVTQKSRSNGEGLDLDRFWKVFSLIEQSYLRENEIDHAKLVDGAIKGMVDALGDPYSYYLSQSETTDFRDGLDGKYEGIGVQLGYKNERLIIVAPLDGGPAKRSDIKSGDVILAVDDHSIADMNLGEVVEKIRGEEGTEVKLTLARQVGDGSEVLEVTIVRESIDAPNMLVNWEDNGIAYISVLRFGTGMEQEWDSVVNDLIHQQVKGVIIDVRDNPGGFLDGAVTIAGGFTNKTVIVSERFADGSTKGFSSSKNGLLQSVPVVVVMNESSASASEILAGALRDLTGATIVGEKSFGKNTVQDAYTLDQGSSVHITVANWMLPSGQIIPEDGLLPNIEVADDEETVTDEQKEKALEVLREQL